MNSIILWVIFYILIVPFIILTIEGIITLCYFVYAMWISIKLVADKTISVYEIQLMDATNEVANKEILKGTSGLQYKFYIYGSETKYVYYRTNDLKQANEHLKLLLDSRQKLNDALSAAQNRKK